MLESITAHLVREVYFTFQKVGMLWSIGKDSTVLLWIARKAFGGVVPFPLIHIDTSYKIPEMIAYRDKLALEWNLDLIVGQNQAALQLGETYPSGKLTRLQCCKALKTDALLRTVSGELPRLRLNHTSAKLEPSSDTDPFEAIMVGLRGDEEGSRSKERYISPRTAEGIWDISRQPAEIWETFVDAAPPGGSVRAHPLLDWTELDIWQYIAQENIPVTPLYFDQGTGKRYRSLGCGTCTFAIDSTAKDSQEVVVELQGRLRSVAERSGRAQDEEDGGTLETLRRGGYM